MGASRCGKWRNLEHRVFSELDADGASGHGHGLVGLEEKLGAAGDGEGRLWTRVAVALLLSVPLLLHPRLGQPEVQSMNPSNNMG